MDDIFIKLELTTVYGKLAGDPANPLLLGIHGWSQRNGWHTWEPLMAPLADAGYCVVSVDMPGWGDSPALDNLRAVARERGNTFAELMETVKSSSLGQISAALYDVGGEYRRNM